MGQCGFTHLRSIPTYQPMRLALLSLLIASLAGVGLGVAISPNAELLDSRGKWAWENQCKDEYATCGADSECCYKHCSTDSVCEVSSH